MKVLESLENIILLTVILRSLQLYLNLVIDHGYPDQHIYRLLFLVFYILHTEFPFLRTCYKQSVRNLKIVGDLQALLGWKINETHIFCCLKGSGNRTQVNINAYCQDLPFGAG
jgi:hypothetical protein